MKIHHLGLKDREEHATLSVSMLQYVQLYPFSMDNKVK